MISIYKELQESFQIDEYVAIDDDLENRIKNSDGKHDLEIFSEYLEDDYKRIASENNIDCNISVKVRDLDDKEIIEETTFHSTEDRSAFVKAYMRRKSEGGINDMYYELKQIDGSNRNENGLYTYKDLYDAKKVLRAINKMKRSWKKK